MYLLDSEVASFPMGQFATKWLCLLHFLTLLVQFILAASISGDCPEGNGEFHRLGKSRFYAFETPGMYFGGKNDWHSAPDRCSAISKDAKVAYSLDKITTNAIVARSLEKLAKRLNLKETVFWIGAMYDSEKQTYQWSSGNEVLYSNIYYQQPAPVGSGTRPWPVRQIGNRGRNKTRPKEKCLAFALPYRNNPNMGWQASWIEKNCRSKKAKSVLCESTIADCDETSSRPHVLTEDKEYYFTEGNWLFANRRFIVNWKPRSFDEAKKYCKQYGLEVYSPVLDDDCLIPYLKMWAPVLSTYHFWTTYKYNEVTEDFVNREGRVIQVGGASGTPMSAKEEQDSLLCVSYIWSFEFKNETRCQVFNCSWHYYMLAPANCKNKIGTICVHKNEDNSRECNFQKEWLDDLGQGLPLTAVVEFGYKGSGIWRSTYKQTFGSRICGDPDRQMISSAVEYWNVDYKGVDYLYDYEETYWVVDENLFQHVGKNEQLCSVSNVTFDKVKSVYTRQLQKVSCNEWHFYLCELVF